MGVVPCTGFSDCIHHVWARVHGYGPVLHRTILPCEKFVCYDAPVKFCFICDATKIVWEDFTAIHIYAILGKNNFIPAGYSDNNSIAVSQHATFYLRTVLTTKFQAPNKIRNTFLFQILELKFSWVLKFEIWNWGLTFI